MGEDKVYYRGWTYAIVKTKRSGEQMQECLTLKLMQEHNVTSWR
eukprot:COSAG02_NODE_3936_length_6021_cov_284.388551_5_plen_44_part_00